MTLRTAGQLDLIVMHDNKSGPIPRLKTSVRSAFLVFVEDVNKPDTILLP